MRCGLKPRFVSFLLPPSSFSALSLVPLSISDTHLHAHPREATLATTRSLEERRRTGVRILIYICGTPQFNYSPASPPLSTQHRLSTLSPPSTPYFIFSDKIQFKSNGTRVNGVNVCVWERGVDWCHYVLSGSLEGKLYPKTRRCQTRVNIVI